jgi:hypothetical protein
MKKHVIWTLVYILIGILTLAIFSWHAKQEMFNMSIGSLFMTYSITILFWPIALMIYLFKILFLR